MENAEQRVAFLRKKVFELTQTDFAEKIGLKHSVISQWEVGITPINEKNIKLICHIFNVNENWLRDGVGEIFDKEDNQTVKEIMELLDKMGKPELDVVLNYVRWYCSQQKSLNQEEAFPDRTEKPKHGTPPPFR
jgi:transcriptional regulator with XRE-family HTH domain